MAAFHTLTRDELLFGGACDQRQARGRRRGGGRALHHPRQRALSVALQVVSRCGRTARREENSCVRRLTLCLPATFFPLWNIQLTISVRNAPLGHHSVKQNEKDG